MKAKKTVHITSKLLLFASFSFAEIRLAPLNTTQVIALHLMLSDYNRSKNFLFGSKEIICKGLNIILKLKNALE